MLEVVSMEPILAFTGVMLIWTIGEYVSYKTKALVSMMLVASMIFLVGFAGGFLPHDMIAASGFLGLGNAVIGIIIAHLGTTMSVTDLKAQWKTFVIGSITVVLLSLGMFLIGELVFDRNVAIAGTASITGGTLSILMVQDKARQILVDGGNLGLMSGYLLMVFPLLILNLKNLVGFLATATILKKEAMRLRGEYRKGNLKYVEAEVSANKDSGSDLIIPKPLQTPYATLFLLGLTVYISRIISGLTNGHLNMFVVALLLGIILRHFKILKPNALASTDSFGILMISIMVIAFGALADIEPRDLIALIWPIIFFIGVGVTIIAIVSYLIGRKVGYSGPLSIAVGLTTLFGFPGTMVLSKEAAAIVAENEEERLVIEQNILPIMVTAGFATVTITSVIIGGIIVGFMVGL